jgi:hypothetical protein
MRGRKPTYATEEERAAARKRSKAKYNWKTRHPSADKLLKSRDKEQQNTALRNARSEPNIRCLVPNDDNLSNEHTAAQLLDVDSFPSPIAADERSAADSECFAAESIPSSVLPSPLRSHSNALLPHTTAESRHDLLIDPLLASNSSGMFFLTYIGVQP